MATGPIVPWDPNNDSGLVAWSCDCLSEASITAAGGTWTNNPAREYDPVKGVRLPTFTASSYLEFDIRPFIAGEADLALGCQISFELETRHAIAYVASDPYFQGINVDQTNKSLLRVRTATNADRFEFSIAEGSFNEVSGLYVLPSPLVDSWERYAGACSSYKKNFHTRFIIVSMGALWQLWVEHQDASGNRIGLSCLTRTGIDMDVVRKKHGMLYRYASATQTKDIAFLRWLWAGPDAARTAIDAYVRNIQVVASAPAQVYHPALRLLVGTGDSYAGVTSFPGAVPSTGKVALAAIGASALDVDHQAFERMMSRIVHETGVNNYASVACHFGGSTIINGYGTSRMNGGTANLPRTYLATDYAVPAATIWSNSMALAVGDYVRPITRNGYVYVVTVSDGAAGVTEPTWPTTLGATVALDGVTYKCMDYDQSYTEASGFVRRGYTNPSILIHYGGFNDADFIQRDLNSPGGVNAPWVGYGYANAGVQFTTLWQLWIKTLLDLNKNMRLVIMTVPIAPDAIDVNGTPTALGRKAALDIINTTYLEAPAYFHALGASYRGRVSTVDLKTMGGWNNIGDHAEDFPDGTHPTAERPTEITSIALQTGIMHMMRGGSNSILGTL